MRLFRLVLVPTFALLALSSSQAQPPAAKPDLKRGPFSWIWSGDPPAKASPPQSSFWWLSPAAPKAAPKAASDKLPLCGLPPSKLLPNLCVLKYRVSTASPECQAFFDQGLG